jgi:hypothetical protein
MQVSLVVTVQQKSSTDSPSPFQPPDLYVASSEECKRLSVWCVSMVGTIGHLAAEAKMDSQMLGLLRATVHPLLDLQKLVAKRIQNSQGIVGKLVGFWDSKEYLLSSQLAQEKVQVRQITCFSPLP